MTISVKLHLSTTLSSSTISYTCFITFSSSLFLFTHQSFLFLMCFKVADLSTLPPKYISRSSLFEFFCCRYVLCKVFFNEHSWGIFNCFLSPPFLLWLIHPFCLFSFLYLFLWSYNFHSYHLISSHFNMKTSSSFQYGAGNFSLLCPPASFFSKF